MFPVRHFGCERRSVRDARRDICCVIRLHRKTRRRAFFHFDQVGLGLVLRQSSNYVGSITIEHSLQPGKWPASQLFLV